MLRALLEISPTILQKMKKTRAFHVVAIISHQKKRAPPFLLHLSSKDA